MIFRFRLIKMLLIFATFFFKNYAAQPVQLTINSEKLYLKQILTKMRDLAVVYDQEQEQEGSSTIRHLHTVNYVIALFDNIVNDFNNGALGTNQEIKYRFINMCNYLKSIEELEPRHLRVLSKQIQKFDDYVKKFCLRRKKYLTQQDLDLFNRITQFNHGMTEGLLNNEYFDIDGYDQCVDWFVHRPWEFVKEHKGLVALTLVAAGVAVGCYYLYPWYKMRHLANQNQQLNVRQLACLVQAGNTCPYHALYNYTCMRDAHGNIDRMQELMNDGDRFAGFLRNCRAEVQNMTHSTRDDITSEEIAGLLNSQSQAIREVLGIDHSNVTIVSDRNNLQQLDLLNAERFVGQQGQLENAHNNFNNEQQPQPQYFIVNTATAIGPNGELLNTATVGGHWVTVGVIPFPGNNEPQALVADSVGLAGLNRNITDAPYINRIHDILTQPLQLN